MLIGLLWYDSSQDDFVTKCNRAIVYYQEKYGHPPTAIYVSPKTAITEIEGITIKQSHSILNNHFWVGMDE